MLSDAILLVLDTLLTGTLNTINLYGCSAVVFCFVLFCAWTSLFYKFVLVYHYFLRRKFLIKVGGM